VHTLLRSGIDTCFANAGTSEMHYVAALDRVPGMRCVQGLFEGVVTAPPTATGAPGCACSHSPAAAIARSGCGFPGFLQPDGLAR